MRHPDIKRMDIAEFRRLGYLQELNRQFLHPLGLAMEVNVDAEGRESLGGVWDDREGVEGIMYGEGMMDPEKAAHVAGELALRASVRTEVLGYVIQPVE